MRMVLLLVGIIIGAQIETLTLSVIQPFILILTDPEIIYTNYLLNRIYVSLGFSSSVFFLAFLAIVIALTYTFRGFYVYFLARVQNKFLTINTAIMSNRLLVKTLKQPYLYHSNNNAVKLQQNVMNSSLRLFALVNSIFSLLIDGFMSLFILIFLMITSFSMTMVVLFFALICVVAYFRIFKNRIQQSGDEEAEGLVQVNKALLQALYGIKEIKISCREGYFTNKFQTVRFKTAKKSERIQALRQLPKLFIESLCFSGAFIVVAGIILLGADLQALIPQLGVFMIAAFKLLPAISRLTNNMTLILRQKSSAVHVYKGLFEQDELLKYHLPIPKITTVSRDIVVSDVTFKYPAARRPILNKVSLTIPHKSSVAIVGLSGAGKSTLVDIILGILPPQEGSVIFNGYSIHHNFGAWANKIGYIPQDIYILDGTLLENVAFGIEKEKINEAQVWNALAQAQLKAFVETLPKGLDTNVGDRGAKLSGGQRQRIGIARALYGNPDILVLDEATSALDNETEKAVMSAIQELRKNKTMIIVAHRLSTIEHCDIVYEVKKRKVVKLK